jgi:hypothetical protein
MESCLFLIFPSRRRCRVQRLWKRWHLHVRQVCPRRGSLCISRARIGNKRHGNEVFHQPTVVALGYMCSVFHAVQKHPSTLQNTGFLEGEQGIGSLKGSRIQVERSQWRRGTVGSLFVSTTLVAGWITSESWQMVDAFRVRSRLHQK